MKYHLIKGKQHEVGSVVYAEEILNNKLCKIKMRCTKVEPKKRIEYESFFPLSIFHPKGMYLFEPKGDHCVFTAVNYFKITKLFKKKLESLISATEKHIKEEGENLKKLLEN